jgi:hypothetical protein
MASIKFHLIIYFCVCVLQVTLIMVMVMATDTDCTAIIPTIGGEGTTCTSKSNETKWIIKSKLVYFNISIVQKLVEEWDASKQVEYLSLREKINKN